jgi:outer membrane protein
MLHILRKPVLKYKSIVMLTRFQTAFPLLATSLVLASSFLSPLAAIPVAPAASTVQATPDLNHPLTLSELLDIALENNPSTSSAWWNARRAAAAVGSAKSAYYPQVDFEGIVNNGRDFKSINGPDVNYTIVGADLVLSMILYDSGERSANVNAAQQSLLTANWQADRNIQRVMMRVLENAYATLHAQEVLQAAHFSFEDAEKVWNTARELNRVGLSSVSDVYTAQAALSQMKMDLSLQKALLDIQKGKLAASLGLAANVTFELAPLDPIRAPQPAQTEDLIALANRQRADLMAKQAQLNESYYRYDQSRAAYGPKLFLNGRGGVNHAFHNRENGGQYQIALNLNVPLFTGFEATYQNRMAYADINLSKAELADLQLEIALEVLTQSRYLEAAQEMLPDAEDNLNNSLKAYEGMLAKYKAGTEGITEVSNAQRQLAAARVRFSDVKTRWLVSIANLAYATGILTPHTETSCQ